MATNDLLTLSDARSALNMNETDNDTELQLFLSGISRRIDKLCGPVVIRTITGERHDGGSSKIWLRERPADSVTTVKEWRNTTEVSLTEESDGTKPSDGFLLDHVGNAAVLIRRTAGSDSTFWLGRRNIVVTYEAGRYANTAAVDETFKLACTAVLRRVWKREQSAWAQTPDFFSNVDDPTGQDRFRGFFRAVDPIINELLPDELLAPQVG